MIFIGGLSGSGKSTYCKRKTYQDPTWEHVILSSVLQSKNKQINNLSLLAAKKNQKTLTAWAIKNKKIFTAKTLLDGHFTIETNEPNGVCIVPSSFFRAINPRLLILTSSTPQEIIRRKKMQETNDQIKRLENMLRIERKAADLIAKELSINLYVVLKYDEFDSTLRAAHR